MIKLQEELIDLENYIISIRNEKLNCDEKYTKLIEIQSKMADSESIDNSSNHLKTIKRMNEKIFDLTEQNKALK